MQLLKQIGGKYLNRLHEFKFYKKQARRFEKGLSNQNTRVFIGAKKLFSIPWLVCGSKLSQTLIKHAATKGSVVYQIDRSTNGTQKSTVSTIQMDITHGSYQEDDRISIPSPIEIRKPAKQFK